MKTRTCVHCGKKFKRARKREGPLAQIEKPDCGRCLVVVQEREGYAKTLAYATARIQ